MKYILTKTCIAQPENILQPHANCGVAYKLTALYKMCILTDAKWTLKDTNQILT